MASEESSIPCRVCESGELWIEKGSRFGTIAMLFGVAFAIAGFAACLACVFVAVVSGWLVGFFVGFCGAALITMGVVLGEDRHILVCDYCGAATPAA